MCFSKHLDILTSWLYLILVSSLRNIVIMFIERKLILISLTEVLFFLSFDTTKKVHCTVHFSVISQNLKKLDGSNNRPYVPEINSKYFVRAQSKHVFINRIDICIGNEVILRYTEKNAHRLQINNFAARRIK